MPHSIDHRGAKLAEPTDSLFDIMAEKSYAAFCDTWGLVRSTEQAEDEGKLLNWREISENRKMAWTAAMRTAWGCVALAGGAKARKIETKKG